MDLSVVIVSYNVKYFLEQCLLSVGKASAGLDVEIWVVDNHSSDDSVGFLKSRFPHVRFMQNKINEGFAAANNRVIRELKGEFVLFLNPDTLVAEDSFSQCIDFLKQHQDAGGLGVRMIDGSGFFLPESKRTFPSPLGAFFKVTGIHHLFPRSRFFSSYYCVDISEKKSGEVDVLSGAFLMARRTVLYEIGGFDTDYFMYGEDIDLSYRLQKAGYKNYYLGQCTILHFKGESTHKKTKAHVRHFYGAMSLFVEKHYRGILLFLMRLGIGFSRSLAYVSLAFSSKSSADPVYAARKILFIGLAEQYAETTNLVMGADPSAVFCGNQTSLPVEGIASDINTVILHEGLLSFGDVIHQMEQLPSGVERLVRAAGSSSVVGSSRRNEKGVSLHS